MSDKEPPPPAPDSSPVPPQPAATAARATRAVMRVRCEIRMAVDKSIYPTGFMGNVRTSVQTPALKARLLKSVPARSDEGRNDSSTVACPHRLCARRAALDRGSRSEAAARGRRPRQVGEEVREEGRRQGAG